jgi:hypothetical protein
MPDKTCNYCKKSLPIDMFYPAKQGKFKVLGHCKPCGVIRQREYRKKNPDKEKTRCKRYREKHRENINAKALERYHRSNKLPDIKTRLWINRIKCEYNLTPYAYEGLLRWQGYKCAICRTEFSKADRKLWANIDHCHKTDRVRGILCTGCNIGLGGFRDNPDACLRAERYLRGNC